MSTRPLAVPASYLVLRKGDEVLLTLRRGTGYFDDWYCVPSGHVEQGEMPIDALLRESLEEVGVHLDRTAIRHIHTMYRLAHDSTGDRADYFFETDKWSGDPINAEPEKCASIGWFPVSALPENVMPHVREAFREIELGNLYSELGLDRIVLNPSKKLP